jgi:glycyl-tRNA synthetase beta subunit
VEADAPPTRAQLGAAAATWAAVSLADKADTLVSLFGAGRSRPGRAIRSGCGAGAGSDQDPRGSAELTGIDRAVTLAQVDRHGEGGATLRPFLLERLRYVIEQRGFDARNVRA